MYAIVSAAALAEETIDGSAKIEPEGLLLVRVQATEDENETEICATRREARGATRGRRQLLRARATPDGSHPIR